MVKRNAPRSLITEHAGGGHDEFASLNARAIYRGQGYEGHWFRATKDWDNFIAPLSARRQSIGQCVDDGGEKLPYLYISGPVSPIVHRVRAQRARLPR